MPKTAAPEGPGQRVAVLSRTTIELREQLEQAASLSGRSLSQEVERRLERTFDFDYLMGDSETALMLRTISTAIQRFEKSAGRTWIKDSATQEAAYDAVKSMVDVMMKPRPIDTAFIQAAQLIDPDDNYMRCGLRTMAIDRAMEELRTYRNLKERELIDLRPPVPKS